MTLQQPAMNPPTNHGKKRLRRGQRAFAAASKLKIPASKKPLMRKNRWRCCFVSVTCLFVVDTYINRVSIHTGNELKCSIHSSIRRKVCMCKYIVYIIYDFCSCQHMSTKCTAGCFPKPFSWIFLGLVLVASGPQGSTRSNISWWYM